MLRGMDDELPAPPAAGSLARMFIGLWPDDGVRDALQRHAERWAWTPASRRVPRTKLHMTLHFLGNVARERVPGLAQGLAVRFDPFMLQLEQAEVWRNQVAVLCPRSVPGPLLELHDRLAHALARLQLASAREELAPHVTLARHAKGSQPAAGTGIRWQVGGYVLVESMADSRYQVVGAYP